MSALTRHSGIAACVSKTSVRGFPSFWPVQLRWNTYAPKVGWTPYGMAFFSPSRLDAANYLGLQTTPSEDARLMRLPGRLILRRSPHFG